jgi:hypothetical protein
VHGTDGHMMRPLGPEGREGYGFEIVRDRASHASTGAGHRGELVAESSLWRAVQDLGRGGGQPSQGAGRPTPGEVWQAVQEDPATSMRERAALDDGDSLAGGSEARHGTVDGGQSAVLGGSNQPVHPCASRRPRRDRPPPRSAQELCSGVPPARCREVPTVSSPFTSCSEARCTVEGLGCHQVDQTEHQSDWNAVEAEGRPVAPTPSTIRNPMVTSAPSSTMGRHPDQVADGQVVVQEGGNAGEVVDAGVGETGQDRPGEAQCGCRRTVIGEQAGVDAAGVWVRASGQAASCPAIGRGEMRGGAGVARSFEPDATAITFTNGPDAVQPAHHLDRVSGRHIGSDCGPLSRTAHDNHAVAHQDPFGSARPITDTSDRKEGHI